eukprot:5291121-Alexandrium_andersonii.AAC.1
MGSGKYRCPEFRVRAASDNLTWQHALEASTERAQERPQSWLLKLPQGACCTAVRADAESADEAGWGS